VLYVPSLRLLAEFGDLLLLADRALGDLLLATGLEFLLPLLMPADEILLCRDSDFVKPDEIFSVCWILEEAARCEAFLESCNLEL
jgi:hypothetical protein